MKPHQTRQIELAMRKADAKFYAAIHRAKRKSGREVGRDHLARRHCRTAERWHQRWNDLRDKLPTPPTQYTHP